MNNLRTIFCFLPYFLRHNLHIVKWTNLKAQTALWNFTFANSDTTTTQIKKCSICSLPKRFSMPWPLIRLVGGQSSCWLLWYLSGVSLSCKDLFTGPRTELGTPGAYRSRWYDHSCTFCLIQVSDVWWNSVWDLLPVQQTTGWPNPTDGEKLMHLGRFKNALHVSPRWTRSSVTTATQLGKSMVRPMWQANVCHPGA